MKYFRKEVTVGIIAVIALVALMWFSCGCVTTQPRPADPAAIAAATGKIAVYVAVRTEAVNNLELAAARPYLVHLAELLEAEPAATPVVLADIIEAEAGRWGADLLPADRALIVETMRLLTASVVVEPDAEGREAAAVAAAFVRGCIAAIDVLLPQG